MSEVLKEATVGRFNGSLYACFTVRMHICSSRRYLSGAAANIEKYHKEMIDKMKYCCHPALKDACRKANETLE